MLWQVAALHAQLQMARAQLSLKLSLVAEKDALIASLLQQTGQVCPIYVCEAAEQLHLF